MSCSAVADPTPTAGGGRGGRSLGTINCHSAEPDIGTAPREHLRRAMAMEGGMMFSWDSSGFGKGTRLLCVCVWGAETDEWADVWSDNLAQ